ncbi:hypothetical protein A5644_21795 [Mycobacterium intracellulare subsp. yongonense]|nr:hypothetical protein A5689_07205 [Mycobacterium intracellulare subsp. yongonense]OCB18030.1 hypothetical protein A5644_21795 [Mycobacterium intracellulare subsp. yongonense]
MTRTVHWVRAITMVTVQDGMVGHKGIVVLTNCGGKVIASTYRRMAADEVVWDSGGGVEVSQFPRTYDGRSFATEEHRGQRGGGVGGLAAQIVSEAWGVYCALDFRESGAHGVQGRFGGAFEHLLP